MRSNMKTTGTVALAAAAFIAVLTMTSVANAAVLSRHDAREARRDVAETLRDNCRQDPQVNTRRERRECARDVRNTLRNMQREAVETYVDCRQDGNRRSECRQEARQYWVDQAAAIAGGNDGNTGGGGDGTVDPDLPQ